MAAIVRTRMSKARPETEKRFKGSLNVQGDLQPGRIYHVETINGPIAFHVRDVNSAGLFNHHSGERENETTPQEKRLHAVYLAGTPIGFMFLPKDGGNPLNSVSLVDFKNKTKHSFNTPDAMHEALLSLHERISDGAFVREVAKRIPKIAAERLKALLDDASAARQVKSLSQQQREEVIQKAVAAGVLLAPAVAALRSKVYGPELPVEIVHRALRSVVPENALPGHAAAFVRLAASTMGLKYDSHSRLLDSVLRHELVPPDVVELYRKKP